MKKGLFWLAVIIVALALCGAFYHSQQQGTTNDTPMTVTSTDDINNTTEASTASNQSVHTIPLEKPPFLE